MSRSVLNQPLYTPRQKGFVYLENLLSCLSDIRIGISGSQLDDGLERTLTGILDDIRVVYAIQVSKNALCGYQADRGRLVI